MREITINEQTYPLTFGMDFLKELNKRRGIAMQGTDKLVGGLLNTMTLIETMGDPESLIDLIEAGLVTEKKRPDHKSVENWLFEQEDVEELATAFLKQLDTIPVLKFMMKRSLASAEKEAQQQFLRSV